MTSTQYKAVAEWAEQESILVTWPYEEFVWKDYSQLDVYLNVIKELEPVVKVLIQARGCDHENILETLREHDIPIVNIELVDFEPDTVIIKGANAFDQDGHVGIITSGFNGGTVKS